MTRRSFSFYLLGSQVSLDQKHLKNKGFMFTLNIAQHSVRFGLCHNRGYTGTSFDEFEVFVCTLSFRVYQSNCIVLSHNKSCRENYKTYIGLFCYIYTQQPNKLIMGFFSVFGQTSNLGNHGYNPPDFTKMSTYFSSNMYWEIVGELV